MTTRRVAALAFFVGSLTLAGCLPEGPGPGCPSCPRGHDGNVAGTVSFETVDRGIHSGVRGSRHLVVREPAAWADLWAEHVAGRVPAPPVPSVDFSREMVVAFFWGEKPTSGYSAEISGLVLNSQALVVRVETASPPPGAIVLQVLTQPFHIARIARSDFPVEFAVVEQERKRSPRGS